jgi:branched-chain amino acid transport system substrate-binding protein
MKMKKIISMLIISALMFTMLSACGEKKEEAGTIKLGLTGPLTGDAAIYGQAAARGAQIAVDEINALEDGAFKFEFKAEDDVADGETAVNAYNSLMDWGMDILVGTVTSGA